MPGNGEPLSWLPAIMAVVLSVVALVAVSLSASAPARRIGLGGIAAVGALSLAVAVWQVSAASERIAELMRRDHSPELAARVNSLEQEVATLKESMRFRSLGPDRAGQLADYLRPYGSRKVVVSCAPNDIEAYHYATDIADALKAAGWDARGPEPTKIFGDVRAMGINLYDAGGSDTARILIAAMDKFAIPYQTRVPPAAAMPADDPLELYVGIKPGPPATAAGVATQ
jgi:hypothetical protein